MSNVNRLTKQERKAIKELRTNRKGGKRVVWEGLEYDEALTLNYKRNYTNSVEAVRADLSAYN
jgi:hypothetical protein